MIGIVADDITGAGDIGIMYAKAGYVTHVYSYEDRFALVPGIPAPDVIVLDTDSRFDPPETAYRKVFAATCDLRKAGCCRFINKTCSVGRGNLGAEFDAMLDALDESFAVVVLGFPKNGRTTLDGIHYVHGKKLEESEFRNDPVHPMTGSDVARNLQPQTKRKVAALHRDIVRQGPAELRKHIEQMKAACSYLFLDVEDQHSLAVIAEAVKDERITAGSSALSEELAHVWGDKPQAGQSSGVPQRPQLGIVCAAGSLMPQTAAQIRHAEEHGVTVFKLDALKLFDAAQRAAEIERAAGGMAEAVRAGRDALVHSPNEAEEVARTKEAGARLGLSNKEVSRLVSSTLADIIDRVLAQTGQNRLVVAGGDTSAAVCAKLGVKGMRIWKEIQAGLPSCVTLSGNPLLLVLKSGSFGKADFLVQAAEHIRRQ